MLEWWPVVCAALYSSSGEQRGVLWGPSALWHWGEWGDEERGGGQRGGLRSAPPHPQISVQPPACLSAGPSGRLAVSLPVSVSYTSCSVMCWTRVSNCSFLVYLTLESKGHKNQTAEEEFNLMWKGHIYFYSVQGCALNHIKNSNSALVSTLRFFSSDQMLSFLQLTRCAQ